MVKIVFIILLLFSTSALACDRHGAGMGFRSDPFHKSFFRGPAYDNPEEEIPSFFKKANEDQPKEDLKSEKKKKTSKEKVPS